MNTVVLIEVITHCSLRRTLRTWAFSLGFTLLLQTSVMAGSLARITAALPDLPAPPQGTAQWVARSMRLNGMPMTVKLFESHLAPDEVFNFYEKELPGSSRNEFRREARGSQQLLSIRSAQYLITVEALATVSGSRGTITVSEPPDRVKPRVVSRFPHPATARLVNCQEYDDDGIEAEHLSFASVRSPGVEAQAFAQELTQAGWQIVRNASMQMIGRGVVIEAQQGAQVAQLTLQPDQSRLAATSIVVVWRKS
ncbi:MAG: hypothetical protein ACJ8OJ_20810 [Povalibacter sp.]|jgi:hypothetical protein